MNRPMGTAVRFLFDRRFGYDDDSSATPTSELSDPVSLAEPEPAVQNPAIFTQEDLDRVRAEALAFGRKQGAAESAGSTEQRIAGALEQIAEGLDAALAAHRQADREHVKQTTAVALAVIRKLFPETSRRHGLIEITEFLEAVIGRIIDKPRLTIRVSGSIKSRLAEMINSIAETHGFAGQIFIENDSTIAEGDCHLSWAGGGAARDSSAIWREIDAAVCRTLGPINSLFDAPSGEERPAEHQSNDAAQHFASANTAVPGDRPAQPQSPTYS